MRSEMNEAILKLIDSISRELEPILDLLERFILFFNRKKGS